LKLGLPSRISEAIALGVRPNRKKNPSSGSIPARAANLTDFFEDRLELAKVNKGPLGPVHNERALGLCNAGGKKIF
jgi:hypothetical protein